MVKIKIEQLSAINEQLASLNDDDVIYVDDEETTRFVLLPFNTYDRLKSKEKNGNFPLIKMIRPDNLELSYDEYENIKEQLNEIFDQTFKPKPEHLN